MDKITIGADPEFFLYNEKNKEIISVEGIIQKDGKGTKNNPLKIEDGFYIQEDGVLAEYNIKPAKTREEFIDYNNYMIKTISALLPENVVPLFVSSGELHSMYLSTPQTSIAGCSVDYNVWTERANPKPRLKRTNLRSSAFHIHVGFPNPTLEECEKIARAFDIMAGIPSVLIDPDRNRRNLYGKSGCIRFQPHGIECRILGSYFLKNDELIGWVYDRAVQAYEMKDSFSQKDYNYYKTINKKIINNYNVDLAIKECEKLNIDVSKLIKNTITI